MEITHELHGNFDLILVKHFKALNSIGYYGFDTSFYDKYIKGSTMTDSSIGVWRIKTKK